MNKFIIIGVGVLLLGTSGTFGFLYFSSKGAAVEPEIAAAAAPPPPPEVFYFDVKPEFIVNFGQQLGMQFLMVDVSVASLDERVTEVLESNLPQLRNDLLMLFSSQAQEHLYTDEGKAGLRTMASEAVTAVLQEHYPEGEISNLFFTRFVMQ
jgi:flagellar FliL protein